MAYISIDTSDLDRLAGLIEHAANGALRNADEALGRVVVEVHGEAVRNAAAFNKDSTGELAAAVSYDTTGNSRRVYANVRQAFFLEYGSPNTGPPRPWLSGPAEKGSDRLLMELAKAGAVW